MTDRYGPCAAPLALALVLLLAGCGSRAQGPAPLVGGDADMPLAAAPMPAAEPPPRAPARLRVAPGETLSGIAHRYHVPQSSLIEANHLQPPYRLLAGTVLVIPGGGRAPVAVAELPAKTAPPPARLRAEETRPAPPTPGPARPLAGPAADVAADVAAEERTATPRKPGEAAAAPAHSGDTFLWPVRGRILANFGTGPGGTHNDGINIAAAKGAPIEAVDAGVVAYAGNELRGYGNLILIKHARGWISAYAHCEQILVKRGQKVSRGQTIARVGATGSVSEPQLHFELRRGNRPVDPRGFLEALPTAAGNAAMRG